MNTLEVHKLRLETETKEALQKVAIIKDSDCPDLKAISDLNDSIERNQQLISMINAHVGCSFQPMWRQK